MTRQFTPHFGVPENSYAVYLTDAPLETVAQTCARTWQSDAAQRSWMIEEGDPFNAFGDAGPYDRPKVGRLYVGKRIKIARGPVVVNSRTVASLTLVSPYPDDTLSRLQPGTMIIVLRLDR